MTITVDPVRAADVAVGDVLYAKPAHPILAPRTSLVLDVRNGGSGVVLDVLDGRVDQPDSECTQRQMTFKLTHVVARVRMEGGQ